MSDREMMDDHNKELEEAHGIIESLNKKLAEVKRDDEITESLKRIEAFLYDIHERLKEIRDNA